MGGEIYREMPPLPERVVAADGSLLYSGDDIQNGRQVWQSIGGMQLGSIWGHGGSSRRTGARIGCTVRLSPCSTRGPGAKTE
jgi:nitric oxide reductase large subunit